MLCIARQPDEPVVELEGGSELRTPGAEPRRPRQRGRSPLCAPLRNSYKKGKTYGTTHCWKDGRTESLCFPCTFITCGPRITFDGWACCSVRCDHLLRWNKLGYPVAHVDWTRPDTDSST